MDAIEDNDYRLVRLAFCIGSFWLIAVTFMGSFWFLLFYICGLTSPILAIWNWILVFKHKQIADAGIAIASTIGILPNLLFISEVANG